MLTITINNPTKMPKEELTALAEYLLKLAGHDVERVENTTASIKELLTPTNSILPLEHKDVIIKDLIPGFQPDEIKEDIDSAGNVWNKEIHARTKSKDEYGVWKLKRGKEAEFQQESLVKSSILKNLNNINLQDKITITNQNDVTSQSIPLVPPAPPAPPAAPIKNFTYLMDRLTELLADGKLKSEQALEAVKSVGLTKIPEASNRPDLIPAILEYIEKVKLP